MYLHRAGCEKVGVQVKEGSVGELSLGVGWRGRNKELYCCLGREERLFFLGDKNYRGHGFWRHRAILRRQNRKLGSTWPLSAQGGEGISSQPSSLPKALGSKGWLEHES